MSGACCDPEVRARPRLLRRSLRALPLLAPSVGLALLPKCPACFAAWFAVATGAGITTTTASHLRTALAVLCIGSAIYALMRMRRAGQHSTTPTSHRTT